MQTQLLEWAQLTGQEKKRRLSQSTSLVVAPLLEQGECNAEIYVSQAEDPHDTSDSVAESDEECPGFSP